MPHPPARQVEANPYVEQEKVDVAPIDGAVINGPPHILDQPRRVEQCSGDVDTYRATETDRIACTERVGVSWSQLEFAGIDVALSHKESQFLVVFDVRVW